MSATGQDTEHIPNALGFGIGTSLVPQIKNSEVLFSVCISLFLNEYIKSTIHHFRQPFG